MFKHLKGISDCGNGLLHDERVSLRHRYESCHCHRWHHCYLSCQCYISVTVIISTTDIFNTGVIFQAIANLYACLGMGPRDESSVSRGAVTPNKNRLAAMSQEVRQLRLSLSLPLMCGNFLTADGICEYSRFFKIRPWSRLYLVRYDCMLYAYWKYGVNTVRISQRKKFHYKISSRHHVIP